MIGKRVKQMVWLWLLLLWGQSGCVLGGAETATPAVSPTATQITTSAIIPTATPSPTITPTPAPTPTGTPIAPLVVVNNQTLGENGRLSISRVDSPVAGWVVVLVALADGSEAVLGQTAVSVGRSEEIAVTIDPLAAQSTLAVRLHAESSDNGRFDFPDGDQPLTTPVAFAVDIDLPNPVITIAEQEVGEDGILTIELIFSPAAGWVRIYADVEGEPGTAVGEAKLAEGRNENVRIPLLWREATPTLHAILYEDTVDPDTLNPPDEDLPLLVNGEPAEQIFRVTLPPDVIVYDQPVINGRFTIDHALSSGPGWVVVHADEGGEPGLIIAFAPLAEGINKEVVVDLGETAVAGPLHLQLHHDNDPVGQFDYPETDLPITVAGQIPPPFTFGTNPGNYLITHSQPRPPADDSGQIPITIPFAITDIDAWLVLYSTNSSGQPDQILGQAPIVPGLNRNLTILIDNNAATDTLIATLHLNAPSLETFDFPDGNDVPLRRNQDIIQAPFQLQNAP